MTAEQLAAENIGLAYYVANQYKDKYVEYDDLVSIACIGLMKAAKAYNDSRGYKFATFAVACMQNEVKTHFRSESRKTHAISIEQVIENSRENDIKVGDMLANEERFEEKLSEQDCMKFALTVLSQREANVIKLRYLLEPPKSQKEASEILGIGQPTISRIEKRALHKMRKVMLS